MSEEPTEFILKDFPATRYYLKFHLTTWYLTGILDEALAEKIVAFIEWEEYIQEAPFESLRRSFRFHRESDQA
jgi:hypothetical protein